MVNEKSKNKNVVYLIIFLVILFVTFSVGVPVTTLLYAKSKVNSHLGKPVTFSDIVFSESGNLCIGFKETGSLLNLTTYYYTIPEGAVRVRFTGTDVMIEID